MFQILYFIYFNEFLAHSAIGIIRDLKHLLVLPPSELSGISRDTEPPQSHYVDRLN